jgi:hypothetical protein
MKDKTKDRRESQALAEKQWAMDDNLISDPSRRGNLILDVVRSASLAVFIHVGEGPNVQSHEFYRGGSRKHLAILIEQNTCTENRMARSRSLKCSGNKSPPHPCALEPSQ